MKHLFFIVLFSYSSFSQSFQTFLRQLEYLPVNQRHTFVKQYLASNKIAPIIERDSLLNFLYYGIADIVLVNGNLQHWLTPDTLVKVTCGDNSLFYRTYTTPNDARLDYQFVVDGVYQLDSLNPRITPSGFGPHSEVQMPKFISSPYLIYHDSIPHGRIDTVYLYRYLPFPLRAYAMRGRSIQVYLPPGYDSLSNLPSIYVHDGAEALKFARMDVVIDNLIAERKIPPLIAVFIPPMVRKAEYNGTSTDKFVKLLCDEIIPMIDRKYRTDTSAFKRSTIGISDGGHVALYAAFSRPDIFHNVGGQSATITPRLRKLTRRRAKENIFSPQFKIYIDCGRYDIKSTELIYGYYEFITMNREYSELLSSLHIPHFYKEVNDGHEWASWRERIPEILQYFYGLK